jgi:amino acid transporter
MSERRDAVPRSNSTIVSGEGAPAVSIGTFRHLVTEARVRFGHPSRSLRWVILAIATVGGWAAIALWLPTQHGRFEGDEQLWPLMITCAVVGCAQAYAQFSGGRADGAEAKVKHRSLLRWWQVVLLVVLHCVVVSVVAVSIVSPVTSDSSFDAVLDVLVLGFFGWVLGPIIGLLALCIVLMAVGFSELAVTDLEKAARLPRGLPRARLLSTGIALFGLIVALLALIAAVPWMGVQGGGRGAAIAAALVLLLQAVHVLPAPTGLWFLVDRLAYLIGIVAAVQGLVFTLVAKATGRSATAKASPPNGLDQTRD